jgi:PTH1 family peptidyl-tRNA hydrolase
LPWLLAGLGNPGTQYETTPHNLGFLAIDRLSARHGIRVNQPDSKALVGLGKVSGQSAILAKPQTFMNLSGTSVEALCAKYEISAAQVLLIFDDLALPWGGIRIRPEGSAGGHNGVSSVIRSLRTQDFPRIRIGIHPGEPIRNTAEFVLSPIRKAQQKALDELLDVAAEAAESIIAEGVEKSMTKFNRRAQG